MKIFLYILIAMGALYLTIWPHEVGHSLAAYLYGCKANWWQTDMSWFLWDSWGGDIDYECLRSRQNTALAVEEIAGIGVNLLLLAACPVIGTWRRVEPVKSPKWRRWLFVATFWWALANYAEAFSYLVFNTLWFKSDIRVVALETGVNRWIWFVIGLALAIFVARFLRDPARKAAVILAAPRGPGRILMLIFVVYVFVVSAVMAAARIVLT